ncbi:TPA: hypothetical protein ACJW4O_004567 [Salmonella enterica subsp. enterica serovar Grumpensis]
MTHSQSGQYVWETAMQAPELVKAVVAFEPGAYAFPESDLRRMSRPKCAVMGIFLLIIHDAHLNLAHSGHYNFAVTMPVRITLIMLNAPEHLKDMLRRLDSCMSKNFWPISLIPSLP